MEPRKKKTPRSKEAELALSIIRSLNSLKQCVEQMDERLLALEERAREADHFVLLARSLGGSPVH